MSPEKARKTSVRVDSFMKLLSVLDSLIQAEEDAGESEGGDYRESEAKVEAYEEIRAIVASGTWPAKRV